MIGLLTANGRVTKLSAQRSEILRGIYDQNRGIRTSGRSVPGSRGPALRRRLGVLLATLAVLVTGAHFIDPSAQTAEVLVAAAPPATENLVPVSVPLPVTGAPAVKTIAPLPNLPLSDGSPTALADVAPLVFDRENLKSLFGLAVRTIVIDAGHGGQDPGATGKMGTLEKDVTLDVARRLRDKLETMGRYRILLVREQDTFLDLNQRAAYANERNTDLFVSIHVNYLPSTSTNAVETYYFGHHRDARTRKLAERENQGSEYSLSEFENVMRNMQDTIKLQESKALAHTIQGSLLRSIRARNQRVLNNGVRAAPFVVLLGVKAPSVLVEIGSLSSPDTEQKLRQEAYRDEISSYVAAGITHYLNQQLPKEHRIHEAKGSLATKQ